MWPSSEGHFNLQGSTMSKKEETTDHSDTKKTWEDLLKHENLHPNFIKYVEKVLSETYNK